MFFGIALTSLTFVLLLVSMAAYYLYHLRHEEQIYKIARQGFYAATALIAVQAVMLMWGILTHHYEWVYVFSYSSNDLPLYYLISTFWAGQEGTFMLWLLYASIYGFVIIRMKKEEEPLVMSFMNLIMAFIVLILIKSNPFTYVWQVNPAGFPVGMTPPDGNGLNPLLQDPYMVIHPPILFAGYSSTMILFAFAMAALIRKKHDDWIKTVYPYALFVAMILGTGIILGGYWAYTTLGWGGYWGWDPVENSSLIPWLTSLALLHGIIIQRRQGGMKRLNIFLAIITFILVLYGSFLTRSGVLTDFSVHSFGESPLSTYLVAFVFLFLGIGLITFAYRVKGVKGSVVTDGLFTREFLISLGMLGLLVLAVFALFGTSWPILSGFFADKAQSVDASAYNQIAGPLAILLGALIALAPVFSWKRSNVDKIKSVAIHFVMALLAGAGFYALGMHLLVPLIISTLAVFILLVNGQIVWLMIRKKNYSFGGYLAHVGVGFMLIGIITSSVYDTSQRITMPLNKDIRIYGYTIRYEGKQPDERGRDHVLLTVNGEHTSQAKYYWSDYSRAYMVAPAVTNFPTQDLYISPIQVLEDENHPGVDEVEMEKQKETRYGSYILFFKDYDMDTHQMGTGNMTIKAVIDVKDSKGHTLAEIKPGIKVMGDKREQIEATFPGTNQKVFLSGVKVEERKLILGIKKDVAESNQSTSGELLAAEITVKPFINVLWLGTVLMVIGFLVTLYNRTQRQRL
ncbi:MAG: heme lyase CcmF/NrfE family subunit [Calditrichaeota bacterium]|nr:MAG: heme lyase CcmF/NrfE family subunit [Calditrichota bacterium]